MLNFGKKYKDYNLKTPISPIIILFSVIIIGTIGYSVLWHDIPEANLVDAFYMTLITVTTIGYGETHHLNSIGRIFTVFIAISGMGSLFYILSVLMENLFILQMNNFRGKKKMLQKINQMKDHTIVIGLGRVGKRTVREFAEKGEEYLVIDINPPNYDDSETIPNIPFVQGDATRDEVLIKAGINRAKGLIVTTANSATTVFVTLSARVLNPNLFIVARSDYDNDIDKMKRAGADRVVNPYSIGGQRLANLMVNPNVVDFFETSLRTNENSINIENILLPETSKWIGKTLINMNLRRNSGATIIAVVRDSTPITNPDGTMILQSGDALLTLGTKDQLHRAYFYILQSE